MPTYNEFLVSLGKDRDKTVTAWCNMLGECEEGDVIGVVDDILAGREPVRTQFETRDDLPFSLRHRAMLRKNQRIEQAHNERLHEQASGNTNRMARFISLLNRSIVGDPMAGPLLAAEHERLKATDDEHGPRYHCLSCRDTGCVPCLDPIIVRKAKQHGLDSIRSVGKRLINYACDCDRGKPLADGIQTDKYNYSPVGRYDAQVHFRCMAWIDQDYQRLEQWIDDPATIYG